MTEKDKQTPKQKKNTRLPGMGGGGELDAAAGLGGFAPGASLIAGTSGDAGGDPVGTSFPDSPARVLEEPEDEASTPKK